MKRLVELHGGSVSGTTEGPGALRERPHPLCLIALTGYGQAEDRRKALVADFDLHLTKPVDPDRHQDFIERD